MIIAIDGPSGVGKSTICKLVAEKLKLTYIDTGAIYRALAYVASELKIALDDVSSLEKLASQLSINFEMKSNVNHVYANSKDVTGLIRTPEAGMAASQVSSYNEVRSALLDLQRDLANSQDSILEGRDIGTVVFPNANLKFYMDATVDERAKRRHKELVEKGQKVDFNEIKKSIQQRDHQDSTRKHAPLKKAEDAIYVDTSNMSIDEVVKLIASHAKKIKKQS